MRLRTLGGQDDELDLRFEVEDTGIGVDPDVMPRLFKAFEQADNSASRHYGGTGLGLAITARLAQLMGGEAGASSTPGQGSRFWFTVRLRRLAAVEPAPSALAAVALLEERLQRERPGRRVLVVDDDPVNRELATELIRAAGQQVMTAADGEEALELLGRQAVDLVLMDMQMPRLDGLATTRRIRAAADGPGPPIIALTANAFSEDRVRCLAAGMNDFIAKPLNLAELHTALWRWLP